MGINVLSLWKESEVIRMATTAKQLANQAKFGKLQKAKAAKKAGK